MPYRQLPDCHPAACIGCGACVAQCPNASAALFVSAKISQLPLLPQGQPERHIRVQKMVDQMGGGECEVFCPKEISLNNIARMNRDQIVAKVTAGSQLLPTS